MGRCAMFDSLKKKLKESAKKLAEKISKEEEPKKKVKPKVKKEKPKKVKAPKKEKIKPEKKAKIPEKVPEKKKEEPEEVAEKPEEIPEPEEKPVQEEYEEELEEPEPPPEIKEPEEEVPEEKEEAPKEKKGFFRRVREKVTEKTLSAEDIDKFFIDLETDLMQSNVALEVIDAFKDNLKKELADKQIKRSKAEETIQKAFETSLMLIVDQKKVNLKKLLKEKKPLKIAFIGVNGSGKTTSIAKVARWMLDNGFKPVLAAGDTFRAASIEQLEHHGEKLGVEVVKHQYGSDSAAVVFDAIRHAEAKGLDVVLADTAGRSHANTNLMQELEKVIRVNKPDLKILVVDSLTGNDAVEQARSFHETVGVDGVIFTKIDVNKKGGGVLSVAWAIKKPILFFGTGQGYSDLVEFKAETFVKELV